MCPTHPHWHGGLTLAHSWIFVTWILIILIVQCTKSSTSNFWKNVFFQKNAILFFLITLILWVLVLYQKLYSLTKWFPWQHKPHCIINDIEKLHFLKKLEKRVTWFIDINYTNKYAVKENIWLCYFLFMPFSFLVPADLLVFNMVNFWMQFCCHSYGFFFVFRLSGYYCNFSYFWL